MPPAPGPGAPAHYADADPWRQASSRQSISSSTSHHQQNQYQQHQQGYRHSRPLAIYSSTANHSAPANAHLSAVRPIQPSPHPSYSRAHPATTAAASASASGRTLSAPVHVQPVAAPPPRSSVMTPASATSHSQQSQSQPQPQSHSQLTGPGPNSAYNLAQTQSQAYSSSSYGNTPAQLQSTLAYHSQYPRGNYAPAIAPVNQLPGAPGGPGGGGIGGAESTSSLPYRTHGSMASSYELSANGPGPGLVGPTSSSIPLQTVPVDTPSNRRGVFANSIAQQRRNEEERNPFYQPPEFDPLNFSALPEKTPRIYDHCVKGLESGIPTEVEFALHHLVIISDERGDKFRFCDFPGLADSLLEAAWEITYLVHGVSFEISYDPISPDDPRINVIDGCYGTPDLVARINALRVDMKSDGLEPVGLGRYSRMVSEAALVIHNMCTLEENAIWLADMAAFKDWVVYLLNMPEVAREKYVEIVNNALETAEMVAPFWVFEKEDGLVPGLLECLKSGDRTHLVLALRVFVCWGMDRPDARKEMCLDEYMTSEILTSLCNTLLLEQDRELLSTVLDFLYQYTSVPANVAHIIALLDSSLPTSLIPRLTNLLLFEAEPLLDERIDQEEIHVPPPNDIPDIPPTLHAEICRLPEPDRCSAWVRTCFTEDEDCEITQLALWNAYRAMFAHINDQQQQQQQPQSQPQQQQQQQQQPISSTPGTPVSTVPSVGNVPSLAPTLGAADFINTVSTSFPLAEAQVIRGEVAKFIIRGIRPLENPVDFQGYPYPRCKWQLSVSSPNATTTSATSTSIVTGAVRSSTKCETRCCRTFDTVEELRDHVYEAHLGLSRDVVSREWVVGEDIRPQNVCLWDECTEYHHPQMVHPQQQHSSMSSVEPAVSIAAAPMTRLPVRTNTLIQHLVTRHLPSPKMRDTTRPAPLIPPRPYLQKRVERLFEYYPTPADKEPLGVAYKALLVMRNVMRNLPPDPPSRARSPLGLSERDRERKGESRSHQLFFSQRRRLLETADYNPVLRREIFELVNEIRSS